MNGLVIGLVLLVVPGCYRDQTLDKTGTSGFRSAVPTLETLKKKGPASAGSCQAEREGFEPSIPYSGISVFETDAFDHSATSPYWNLAYRGRYGQQGSRPCPRDCGFARSVFLVAHTVRIG
jgi:hypothetical protein